MKFGGTSVGPTESIDGVARIVATADEKQAGGADAGGGIAETGWAAARGQAQGLTLQVRCGGLRWLCRGRREGRHKACPYGSGEGIAEAVRVVTGGQAQGLPLRKRRGDCGGRVGGGARAGTRPAPTGEARGLQRPCGWRREGRHKACPYGNGVGIAEAARRRCGVVHRGRCGPLCVREG